MFVLSSYLVAHTARREGEEADDLALVRIACRALLRQTLPSLRWRDLRVRRWAPAFSLDRDDPPRVDLRARAHVRATPVRRRPPGARSGSLIGRRFQRGLSLFYKVFT